MQILVVKDSSETTKNVHTELIYFNKAKFGVVGPCWDGMLTFLLSSSITLFVINHLITQFL